MTKAVYKTRHTFTKGIEGKTNTNDNNNKNNDKSNNFLLNGNFL